VGRSSTGEANEGEGRSEGGPTDWMTAWWRETDMWSATMWQRGSRPM